ncbi:hypothetical protein TNCV_1184451 [Trichonephila clavipes]|nr:hypothetical protein TNCV_1184451 [Trichonephila clavipes]
MACPKYSVACHHWHACHWFAIPGLDSEGIQRLVWPARSPYLNPIENAGDALGRQVAGRNHPPTNKNTLIRALTEEWDKLPPQLLDNVVQSMVLCGCGSLAVKVTDSRPACEEFKPSTAEDPLCKGAMYVKSVEAQISSCGCDVEVRRGVPAQESSSSLENGSKSRCPSLKALE